MNDGRMSNRLSVRLKQKMKLTIIVTLTIILTGCINTALSQNSASEPSAPFSVDAYKQISSGMTRVEIRNRLGDPAAKRANSLPKGPFWGPQEGIDINTLDSLRRYEEWQYEHKGTIYLIWFGDPAREKSAWRTIGKTSYPKGAVF
jgi:hypothetical protein